MTEQNIPANAEGLSNKSIIAPKLIEEAKVANKSAGVAYAIISVCKAAAKYVDDNPDYEGAKGVNANIAICLGQANEMVVDMMVAIEGIIASGRKS